MDVIWCSAFNIVAVIVPPSVATPEKVTKSFSFAPCAGSITVTVVDPFDAENVISPSAVVCLRGVISLNN
jgi:hypothetical protein